MSDTITLADVKQYFITVLNDDESAAKNRLAQFRKEFDKSPAHALQWSEGAFQAAADLDVIQAFRFSLDAAFDFQHLKWATEQRALAGAFDSPRDGLRGLLPRYHAQKWAEYANTLRSFRVKEEPLPDPVKVSADGGGV